MRKLNLFLCVLAVALIAGCASSGKAAPETGGSAPASQGSASQSNTNQRGTSQSSTNEKGTSQSSASQSPERLVNSGIPLSIRNAMKNVPEDMLVGVGTARMASLNQSRTISLTRARAELSRQMDTVVQDMVRDYTSGSEVDHSAVMSYQENITVALSRAQLVGSSILEEDQDANGNYWTAVTLSKAGAASEIKQAIAEAKLRVPAMASFDAESRMNEAFDRLYRNEVGFSDR